MINTQNQCVYAAFFMEGAHNVGYDEAVTAWDSGCVELVSAICGYAEHLDLMVRCATANCPNLDFPGVFEYEVCTPFGEWITRYVIDHDGPLPSKVEGGGQLAKYCAEFFIQHAETDP